MQAPLDVYVSPMTESIIGENADGDPVHGIKPTSILHAKKMG